MSLPGLGHNEEEKREEEMYRKINKGKEKKEETDEMMWRHSVNSFRKRALTPQG